MRRRRRRRRSAVEFMFFLIQLNCLSTWENHCLKSNDSMHLMLRWAWSHSLYSCQDGTPSPSWDTAFSNPLSWLWDYSIRHRETEMFCGIGPSGPVLSSLFSPSWRKRWSKQVGGGLKRWSKVKLRVDPSYFDHFVPALKMLFFKEKSRKAANWTIGKPRT